MAEKEKINTHTHNPRTGQEMVKTTGNKRKIGIKLRSSVRHENKKQPLYFGATVDASKRYQFAEMSLFRIFYLSHNLYQQQCILYTSTTFITTQNIGVRLFL